MRGMKLWLCGGLFVAVSGCGGSSETDSEFSPSGGFSAGGSDGKAGSSGASNGGSAGSAGSRAGSSGAASAGQPSGGSGGFGGSGGSADQPPDEALPQGPLTVAVDGNPQPADLACAPPTAAETTTAIQLQGFVEPWRYPSEGSSNLSYIPVQAFAPSDMTTSIAAGNSGTTGYTLSVPSGSPSLLHVLAERSQHPTYSMNVRLDAATITYDLPVVFRTADPQYPTLPALDDLRAAVAVDETAGRAVLIGRVVDCQGRPLEHAIVTLSGQSSDAEASIYYFSVADDNLPVVPSARSETDQQGEFFIPEIAGAPGPFTLRAWGFLTASDVEAGFSGLELISKLEMPIPADAVVASGTKPATVVTDLFPTQGPL
jgi:hypothetical protein